MMHQVDIDATVYGMELASLLRGTERAVFEPRPGRQEMVFNCEADVVGFGGKAGGNKTYTAYGLGYYKHRETILFREEFSQMNHSIIPKGKAIYEGSPPTRVSPITHGSSIKAETRARRTQTSGRLRAIPR